ncbi:unnamed protein product, partial [Lymnaea stagnalis]
TYQCAVSSTSSVSESAMNSCILRQIYQSLTKINQIYCKRQHHATESIAFENQPFSWLFVSNAVGGEYGAQVNLDLDLENRLLDESAQKLKFNVEARGANIDVCQLVTDYKKFQLFKKQRADLAGERDQILTELKLLNEKSIGSDAGVESPLQDLQKKLAIVKGKINLQTPYWELEESIMYRCLKLPNDLHITTPLDKRQILREHKGSKDSTENSSHINIAKKFDLIKFSTVGPKAYYLKGDLAKAELALTNKVVKYLKSHNYRFMAGPEFFKSPIIEGCGLDIHNPHEVLTMKEAFKEDVEPMNHLIGISPATFVGYVAKTCIGDKVLPLKMFACGRSYQNSDLPGLYGAVQSIQAGVFSCVKKDDLELQFDETVNLIWNFLEPFGLSMRLSQASAKELKLAEQRRLDVQILAPSLKQHVTIASVSDLGDFVSRRLMVKHSLNHADFRPAPLVQMVSGTALNITSLLAAWMEHGGINQVILIALSIA